MIAYSKTSLHNLEIVKEAKSWLKQDYISKDQFNAIVAAYPSGFYHPNVIIRILLFIATLVALGGISGIFTLIFNGAEDALSFLFVFYGVASWLVMEFLFIKRNQHFKSGVNEAILYHSIAWILAGIGIAIDFNEHGMLLISLALVAFAAIRYIDLLSTFATILLFGYLLFYELFSIGGMVQSFIPLLFIVVFTPLYFLFHHLKNKPHLSPWAVSLLIGEAVSLAFIYLAGNYFVVRELSISMLDLYLEPGEDIPFSFVFYVLTVLIPIVYLFVGIKYRDIVILRVSLVALAFSVFTFKYYFSLGHPEITLTLAGAALVTAALLLLKYLKVPRHGFTREILLKEKWADSNPEAFIISQTLGGNKMVTSDIEVGGGGTSGGGGSSDTF